MSRDPLPPVGQVPALMLVMVRARSRLPLLSAHSTYRLASDDWTSPSGFQHPFHPISIMSTQELVHAYRHLLRWSLRAVQFSKPARFLVRDTLRAAFRDKTGTFEPSRVQSTIWFLESAATYVGVEHKILKNLLHVRSIQRRAIGPWKVREPQLPKFEA